MNSVKPRRQPLIEVQNSASLYFPSQNESYSVLYLSLFSTEVTSAELKNR